MEKTDLHSPVDPDRIKDLDKTILLEDKETISEAIETLLLLQDKCNDFEGKLSQSGIDFVCGLDDCVITNLCARLVYTRYHLEG